MPPKPKPNPQSKKRRRLPKTERQLLDAECMEYLKQIVRLRDKTCVTPGKCSGHITASHWQKRGRQKTRYSLENVNAQCAAHNQRHNYYQDSYDLYMLNHYGYDICRKLAQEAGVFWKWSVPELREIRDGLKVEYERLKNERG